MYNRYAGTHREVEHVRRSAPPGSPLSIPHGEQDIGLVQYGQTDCFIRLALSQPGLLFRIVRQCTFAGQCKYRPRLLLQGGELGLGFLRLEIIRVSSGGEWQRHVENEFGVRILRPLHGFVACNDGKRGHAIRTFRQCAYDRNEWHFIGEKFAVTRARGRGLTGNRVEHIPNRLRDLVELRPVGGEPVRSMADNSNSER